MAFEQAFTVSQILGQPSAVTLTDTSTGTDAAIATRRIYLQTPNGSYLVEDGTTTIYEVWSIAFGPGGTKSINALDKDYALKIKVEWLNASNTVLYTKESNYGLTQYNENFDYTLTQRLAANPLLANDKTFWQNKQLLRTAIDSGNQAMNYASDLFNAQLCYEKATNLRLNAQYNY
jgi:hypothetical protein